MHLRIGIHAVAVGRSHDSGECVGGAPPPAGERHVGQLISAADHQNRQRIGPIYLAGQVVDEANPGAGDVRELGEVRRQQRHRPGGEWIAEWVTDWLDDLGWVECFQIERSAGKVRRQDAAMREQAERLRNRDGRSPVRIGGGGGCRATAARHHEGRRDNPGPAHADQDAKTGEKFRLAGATYNRHPVGILSPEHLVPLAILVVTVVLLCVAARRAPGRWIDAVAVIMALVIVIAELSWQPYTLANHVWSVGASLPVQLCDVGGFVAAAALLWRQLLLVEVAYFWGLGGTLQALLTPDLKDHFPSFPYLQFYVTHDMVILAALFLVVGLGLLPRRGAVRRIFVLTLAFAALVGLIDLVTGGNYMYLRAVPVSGSLLNLMGPWPWYIVAGAVLTLAVLAILDAPFRLSSQRRSGPRL